MIMKIPHDSVDTDDSPEGRCWATLKDKTAPGWVRSGTALILACGHGLSTILMIVTALALLIRWIWQPVVVLSALYLLATALS